MGLLDSIKEELSGEWESFERMMLSSLDSDYTLLNRINGYLLENSGKKLRPMLALLAAGAGGEINGDVLTCAAVAEIMHTATLLHDDVVDESDMRRGSLTVRSLFSPGASVLMGDYWLSKSVHLLVKMGDMRIMGLFCQTIEDLATGEMLQMEKAESLDTAESDYLEIIRCKTASLFVSAVESAAIASGAPETAVGALHDYALNLGLLFQMRDDILDYSSSDAIGKDSDCDISERKITLPLLCAFENAPSEKEKIIKMMSSGDAVRQVKSFVLENGGIASAGKKMALLSSKAKDSIKILPENKFRQYLCAIVDALSA